jgi:hypothetical protein
VTVMLSRQERDEILVALRQWAANAPPDPVAGVLLGGPVLTPLGIVAAVEENSLNGQMILRVIEVTLRRSSLKEVTTLIAGRLDKQAGQAGGGDDT